MAESSRTEHVTREAVLNLLSNDEIARVSTAEAATGLTEGQEYLDLEHLDQGVQQAKAVIKGTMGHVLPRTCVADETWKKILAQLAH